MKRKEKLQEFLTVRELATWLKLSESHVYFMVNKKKIPFAKLGGKLLFDKQKISQWIEDNSSAASSKKKKPGRPRMRVEISNGQKKAKLTAEPTPQIIDLIVSE